MYTPLVETLTIATLLIPLFAILWFMKTRVGSKLEGIINLLLFWSLILYIFFAAPWGFLGYFLRYGLLAICAVASIFFMTRIRRLPLLTNRGKLGIAFKLIVTTTLIVLDILVVKGWFYSDAAVELSFPLRNGRYYVLQGGDSPITNFFHNTNPTQRYAVDIVKLNGLGCRARGIYPRDLGRYEMFGETVYAPCEGVVIAAIDGIPDLTPPFKDLMESAGNHIVLECKGVRIYMAHMMNGSIGVRERGFVKKGKVVGKVGNSGNTTEPHLHIHAIRSEDGSIAPVPLLFDKRFLSMNSVFVN